MGGVAGGLIGAGLSAYRGDDNKTVAREGFRGVFQGGTTAAASSFACVAASESVGTAFAGQLAGGVVGGAVGWAWQMERCQSFEKEDAKSWCRIKATATSGLGTAGALAGQVCIPIPVLGGLVGGMVGRGLALAGA